MEDVGERGNPDAVHPNGNARMKTAVSAPPPPGQVLPAPLVLGFGAIWRVRGFLLLQIAVSLSMVSIHFGLLIGGYRHGSAGTVELGRGVQVNSSPATRTAAIKVRRWRG